MWSIAHLLKERRRFVNFHCAFTHCYNIKSEAGPDPFKRMDCKLSRHRFVQFRDETPQVAKYPSSFCFSTPHFE